MTTLEIENRVIEIVSYLTKTDPKTIKPSTYFYGDLAVDSLDYLEIVLECEKSFGIEIPTIKFNDCSKVSNLVSIIEKGLNDVEL